MKTYPVPALLLQDIVNYLQDQKYKDVVRLLAQVNEVVVGTDQPIEMAKRNGQQASDDKCLDNTSKIS